MTALVAFGKRRIGLEIGASQIVEQNIELDVEQIPPAPSQMVENGLLVRQQKIMRRVELLGIDRFMGQIDAGNLPWSMTQQSLELYMTEVAPVVKKETAAAS